MASTRAGTAHDMFLDIYGDQMRGLYAWLRSELGPHGMMDSPSSEAANFPLYHAFVDAVYDAVVADLSMLPPNATWVETA